MKKDSVFSLKQIIQRTSAFGRCILLLSEFETESEFLLWKPKSKFQQKVNIYSYDGVEILLWTVNTYMRQMEIF